jgi:hypothetical protein
MLHCAAALAEWAVRQDEPAALEALWCLETIGVPEPALLRRLLRARDFRVRAAAAAELLSGGPGRDAVEELFGKFLGREGEVLARRSGPVRLGVNLVRGLRLWVDGRPVELKEETELELGEGRHALSFLVDSAARGGEGLRASVAEVAGSTARVEVLNGP